MLPVTAIGTDRKKGDLGSPYAIKDPYKIDENLSEDILGLDIETQFAAFVEAAHKFGINVVCEFVFRTASVDSDIALQHPEWFYWIPENTGDRPAGSIDKNKYGPPIFTSKEMKEIKRQIEVGEREGLVPPHSEYRKMFKDTPVKVVKQNNKIIGFDKNNNRLRIPGAFADWPPDDSQPVWSDVTYLKLFDHKDFNYIAYNTVRMYDSKLNKAKFRINPLWEYIQGIVPYYIKNFDIDGIMIDMGHSLPTELRQGIISKAIDGKPDFILWEENFLLEKSSADEGYDAVLGYISSTKELQDKLRQQNPESIFDWRNWWQNPETDYVAFIGKDNIVFHTLIFPAMLNGRGENYILPKNVPANEFLNLEGQKLSKSRNWSIDLKDYIKDFPSEQMIDTLRYGLAMSFPETKDSDFTWKEFQARNNNELAAILGNFVNRSLTFVHKYFEGKVPKFSNDYKWIAIFWRNIIEYFEFKGHEDESILEEVPYELKKLLTDNDVQLIYALWHGLWKINKNYEKFRFRDAITETMNVARAANKYFNDEEPWKTAKSDIDKCGKTIFVCVQLVNALSRIFSPILPHVSKKISYILNVPSYTGEARFGKKEEDRWFSIAYPQIENGVEINETEILFTKLEDDVIQQQIEKLGKESSDDESGEGEAEEPVDEITFDDFMKIQLKTAKILEAEKVKKSKKLIKLIVDLGREKRQILAGVAEHYQPEDLLGKTIVVVANLKPAKLMGIESQGMMLAASNKEGKLCFVTPVEESIGVGADVR